MLKLQKYWGVKSLKLQKYRGINFVRVTYNRKKLRIGRCRPSKILWEIISAMTDFGIA